jgi:lysophospholipase L1-like esterase
LKTHKKRPIKNKKQIVILGDSLPLPRSEPQKVKLADTYPALLNKKFGSVLCFAYGAATAENIYAQASYLVNNTKHIFIFHFGIVDCCPRSFSKGETLILKALKIRIPEKLVKVIKKYRCIRKTNPKKFEKICNSLKKLNLGTLFILPIADATDKFEETAPGVKNSIKLYNKILKKTFKNAFIKIKIQANKHLMSDFHHLNKNGHRAIFKAISSKIKKFYFEEKINSNEKIINKFKNG